MRRFVRAHGSPPRESKVAGSRQPLFEHRPLAPFCCLTAQPSRSLPTLAQLLHLACCVTELHWRSPQRSTARPCAKPLPDRPFCPQAVRLYDYMRKALCHLSAPPHRRSSCIPKPTVASPLFLPPQLTDTSSSHRLPSLMCRSQGSPASWRSSQTSPPLTRAPLRRCRAATGAPSLVSQCPSGSHLYFFIAAHS
jgi:hypothetical protein